MHRPLARLSGGRAARCSPAARKFAIEKKPRPRVTGYGRAAALRQEEQPVVSRAECSLSRIATLRSESPGPLPAGTCKCPPSLRENAPCRAQSTSAARPWAALASLDVVDRACAVGGWCRGSCSGLVSARDGLKRDAGRTSRRLPDRRVCTRGRGLRRLPLQARLSDTQPRGRRWRRRASGTVAKSARSPGGRFSRTAAAPRPTAILPSRVR
jgi:hypothetical protein